jgi:hypothetical protein
VTSPTYNTVDDFSSWLDAVLAKRLPAEVQAFCFNLYDGIAQTWDFQLAGTREFAENDSEWAAHPIFLCAEVLFIPKDKIGVQWEQALSVAIELVSTYLRAGTHRDILRRLLGVAVGFVDGDLTILWPHSAA